LGRAWPLWLPGYTYAFPPLGNFWRTPCIEFADSERTVSSAKRMVLKFETSGKSFTYNRNRRGPNVDPCGTPQVNLTISDLLSFITT